MIFFRSKHSFLISSVFIVGFVPLTSAFITTSLDRSFQLQQFPLIPNCPVQSIRRPSFLFFSPTTLSDSISKYSLDDVLGRHRFIQRVLDTYEDIIQYDELMSVCIQTLVYCRHRANLQMKEGETKQEYDLNLMEKSISLSDSDIDEIKNILNSDGMAPSSPNRIMERAEHLFLPDPDEDPDGFQGIWDIVSALEGFEFTKFMRGKFENHNNQEVDEEVLTWNMRALACRILVYYDFLSEGLGTDVTMKTNRV